MTYSNVSQLFDFHDRVLAQAEGDACHVGAVGTGRCRARRRPSSTGTSTPGRRSTERPRRWVQLVAAGIVSVDEVRTAERLDGRRPGDGADRRHADRRGRVTDVDRTC